jgi:hypothetical protein
MAAKRKSTHEEDEGEERTTSPAIVESDVRPATHSVHDSVQVGPQEVDMTGYEGAYVKKSEQAEWEAKGSPEDKPPMPYGLKVDESDPMGQTHHAQNNDHHWSGTKDQFENQFKEA